MRGFSRQVLAASVALAAAWPAAAASKVELGQSVGRATLPTLDGGRHDVIDPDARANVLVFFRPRHPQSERTLGELAGCAREFAGKPVHWVAVVSSTWPREEVRAVVAAAGIAMPVLIDEGDALYGALGVRLHPSVLIADRDGKLVAFEALRSCPVVRVRVQHALGELGAAEAERAVNPAKAAMPSSVEGAVANRHVKLGREYARAGKWGAAEAQAREAIAKDPGHAPAHAFLGEVLAAKGDCDAARQAYDEALRLDPANDAAAAWKAACRATR
jgi:tetratricopeptide (TPR) repeat protein